MNDLKTLYTAEQSVSAPIEKPENLVGDKTFQYEHTPYIDEIARTVDELDGLAKENNDTTTK